MHIQQKKGLWVFEKDLPWVAPEHRITLGEGNTPCEKHDGIYFKYEFANPTGSVKDRGVAFQISVAHAKGMKKAVISSSGNAAISAASYCTAAHIELHIFLSSHVNKQKLHLINQKNSFVIQTAKPIRESMRFAHENHAYNLRQSKDPQAVFGFSTLGLELKDYTDIDAIFIPVSSGTTVVGLWVGLQKLHFSPAIHIVQTETIHPISKEFDTDFVEQKKSIADGIVAKVTDRRQDVIKIVKKSGGSGWIVNDRQILKASDWLHEKKIPAGFEAAATLAALWKAQEKKWEFKNPLCILTGLWRDTENV